MVIKNRNFVRVREYEINLSNVSSFKIHPGKLIFNMSYSTVSRNGYMADFIFVPDFTDDDVSNVLNNEYFKENFQKIFNGTSDVYINVNSVSSFKYEAEKNRYIINFNTIHTYDFTPEKQRVMAEFMYAYERGTHDGR